MNIKDKIIGDIFDELKRAESLHPAMPVNFMEHSLIIGEEYGEYQKAILDYHFSRIGSVLEIRKELIQTAAMCIRALLTEEYEV